MSKTNRREFLQSTGMALVAAAAPRLVADEVAATVRFPISLAQWSLNKSTFAFLKSGIGTDPLNFAKVAKEHGCVGIEYVNQFYKAKAKDKDYHATMKRRADDLGIKHVLIMCDGEGNLGDPNDTKRTAAVENHYKWADLAKYLGCHSIRVNAASDATKPPEEQARLAADGLRKLTEFGAQRGLNVIVENHGGMSSNGAWLASVMKLVDHPRCGTLPDFGNFQIKRGEEYDRYKGVAELMPYAKGVSAKSHDFDAAGNETKTDYKRMLKIVVDAGYKGFIGIEYEGSRLGEHEGITATKKLLDKVIAELKV